MLNIFCTSLKYLPISEIKFVPLLMGMEVFVICFAHYKFTKILPSFYTLLF